MRNQFLTTVALAMLGACVGGIDTSTPGGDDDGGGTARQMFDSTVSPLLAAKCQSCHVGSELSSTNMFLGPDGPKSFYDTLVKDRAVNGGFDPASAMILLKGPHEGPEWLPDEKAKITSWLQAELKERGAPPPTDPTNPTNSARGAEMAFAGCMLSPASITDYNAAGSQAYQVANMNTEQGRCRSCHSPGGAGGQWLGVDTNNTTYKDMYAKWQQEVFFTGVFQAQLQTNNTYKIGTAQTKICNKGKEKDNNLGTHPRFDCTQNNSTALNNLKSFVDKVQARVDAKDPTCGPAAFAPPTP